MCQKFGTIVQISNWNEQRSVPKESTLVYVVELQGNGANS